MSISDADLAAEIKEHVGEALNKQLYLGFSTVIDEARWEPPLAVVLEHVKYLRGLEESGALFAAGSFIEESGARLSGALVVIRAEDQDAAMKIFADDPFHKQGYRQVEVTKWQVNFGRMDLGINFSTGRYEIA